MPFMGTLPGFYSKPSYYNWAFLFARRGRQTRSAELRGRSSVQEADAALFTGKAIRMATASLATVGWEGSHRKEVGT